MIQNLHDEFLEECKRKGQTPDEAFAYIDEVCPEYGKFLRLVYGINDAIATSEQTEQASDLIVP